VGNATGSGLSVAEISLAPGKRVEKIGRGDGQIRRQM
jgi:hypothetical protein